MTATPKKQQNTVSFAATDYVDTERSSVNIRDYTDRIFADTSAWLTTLYYTHNVGSFKKQELFKNNGTTNIIDNLMRARVVKNVMTGAVFKELFRLGLPPTKAQFDRFMKEGTTYLRFDKNPKHKYLYDLIKMHHENGTLEFIETPTDHQDVLRTQYQSTFADSFAERKHMTTEAFSNAVLFESDPDLFPKDPKKKERAKDIQAFSEKINSKEYGMFKDSGELSIMDAIRMVKEVMGLRLKAHMVISGNQANKDAMHRGFFPKDDLKDPAKRKYIGTKRYTPHGFVKRPVDNIEGTTEWRKQPFKALANKAAKKIKGFFNTNIITTLFGLNQQPTTLFQYDIRRFMSKMIYAETTTDLLKSMQTHNVTDMIMGGTTYLFKNDAPNKSIFETFLNTARDAMRYAVIPQGGITGRVSIKTHAGNPTQKIHEIISGEKNNKYYNSNLLTHAFKTQYRALSDTDIQHLSGSFLTTLEKLAENKPELATEIVAMELLRSAFYTNARTKQNNFTSLKEMFGNIPDTFYIQRAKNYSIQQNTTYYRDILLGEHANPSKQFSAGQKNIIYNHIHTILLCEERETQLSALLEKGDFMGITSLTIDFQPEPTPPLEVSYRNPNPPKEGAKEVSINTPFKILPKEHANLIKGGRNNIKSGALNPDELKNTGYDPIR